MLPIAFIESEIYANNPNTQVEIQNGGASSSTPRARLLHRLKQRRMTVSSVSEVPANYVSNSVIVDIDPNPKGELCNMFYISLAFSFNLTFQAF
jgi:hypothetical protein